MSNLRDVILGAPDLAHEDVTVPEWGNLTVRVAEMSALDRITWDEETAAAGDKEPRLRAVARFVVRCLRDPASGARVFIDSDVDRLVERSARPLVRLFEVAARVNSIDAEAPGGLSPKD